MTKISLTENAKKVIHERLESSKNDLVAVITEFERFTWCSTHRAQWTSIYFEDKVRINEFELLGKANGLEVYADEDAAYILHMAKEIILDGKSESGRNWLIIKDLK